MHKLGGNHLQIVVFVDEAVEFDYLFNCDSVSFWVTNELYSLRHLLLSFVV